MPLYSNKLNEAIRDKAKKYLPDWLADTLAPEKPDPTDVINPLAMGAGLMGPLISIYKPASYLTKAERVAARNKGATKFLQSAQKLVEDSTGNVSNNLMRAAEELYARYPRVAAHMRLGHREIPATAETVLPIGKVTRPVKIDYSSQGLGNASDSYAQAIQTMFHEATHTAQGLSNSAQRKLYHLAGTLFGYEDNPFEVTARWVGTKARYPNMKDTLREINARASPLTDPGTRKVSKNAITMLEDLLNKGYIERGGLKQGFTGYEQDLVSRARNILNTRKAKGWQPKGIE